VTAAISGRAGSQISRSYFSKSHVARFFFLPLVGLKPLSSFYLKFNFSHGFAMALNSVATCDGQLPLLEKSLDSLQLELLLSFSEESIVFLSCYTVLHSCERNKEEGMLPPSQHVQNNFESWT